MIKVKNAIKIAIIFVILMSIGSGFVNLYYVPKIREDMVTINALNSQMGTSIVAMELPMRVLGNLTPQIETSQRMFELYQNYRIGFIVELQQLNEKISKANSMMTNTSPFQLGGLDEHKEIFLRSLSALEIQVADLQNILNDEVVEVVILENAYDDLFSGYEAVVTAQYLLHDETINYIALMVNQLIIVLVLFVFVFGFGLLNFVNQYLVFVYHSFIALRNHQYDFKKLPKVDPIFVEENEIKERVRRIFDENMFTEEIRSVLIGSYVMDDAIELLFGIIRDKLGIDRIGISFVDYEHEKIVAEYGVISEGEVLLGSGFEVPFNETSLFEMIHDKRPIISNDIQAEFQNKPQSKSLELLDKEGVQSSLTLPIVIGDSVYGMIFLSSFKKNYFKDSHLRIGEKIIHEIKGVLNQTYFIKVVLSKITTSFSELVDQKDNETGDHIKRMVLYSTALAKGLKNHPIESYRVTDRFLLEIERNAAAHDIGKVNISDSILKKPAKLTDDEWAIMKTHAAIGADIFKELRNSFKMFDDSIYKVAEEIARHHHERWDGTGYPNGLKGESIPLSARIVAIADVFDALTSKRVYKKPFDLEVSLNIIKEASGSHLDPILVDVFFENMDEIMSIYNTHNRRLPV